MLRPAPPLTNVQRQAAFQAAHPGYDRRRKARQRAVLDRLSAKRRRAQGLAPGQSMPVEAKPQPLMLPAPVENPVLVELNALAASLASAPARALEPMPLAQQQAGARSDAMPLPAPVAA
jgi:hypothetical protein